MVEWPHTGSLLMIRWAMRRGCSQQVQVMPPQASHPPALCPAEILGSEPLNCSPKRARNGCPQPKSTPGSEPEMMRTTNPERDGKSVPPTAFPRRRARKTYEWRVNPRSRFQGVSATTVPSPSPLGSGAWGGENEAGVERAPLKKMEMGHLQSPKGRYGPVINVVVLGRMILASSTT